MHPTFQKHYEEQSLKPVNTKWRATYSHPCSKSAHQEPCRHTWHTHSTGLSIGPTEFIVPSAWNSFVMDLANSHFASKFDRSGRNEEIVEKILRALVIGKMPSW